jgi:hypothetical protein
MIESIITSVIGNIISSTLFRLGLIQVRWTKRGFREVRIRRANQVRINRYLKDLFSSASTIDVVSNRLSWIEGDSTMEGHILTLAQQGKQFRFHLPNDNEVARRIRSGRPNITVFVSSLPVLSGEHPRFTLTNRNRPGSGILAVGFQDGPDWRITEFTARGHPQIVAIARGYVESLERTGNEVC